MYIDTSVAVKLYTPEPDSRECEGMIAARTLVSSELLYCELRSALAAKERQGVISAEMLSSAWESFLRDLAARTVRLMALDATIVHEAARVIDQANPTVPLRALDSIHLATFMRTEAGPLFTKDRRMRAAAATLGLPLAGEPFRPN